MSFGYAVITVLSQSGVIGAQTAILAGSAATVSAAFFDSNDNPLAPAALRYRLDDLNGGVILNWTGIVPSAMTTLTITAAQNAMISLSESSEWHQVTFMFTDAAGNVFLSSQQFIVNALNPAENMLNG